MREESGRRAVEMSEAIDEYKKAEVGSEANYLAVRQVGDKTFRYSNGVWIDAAYKEGMKVTRVKYAGDEYFKLLADKPELKKYFALGEKIIVCLDEKSAVVVE